MKTFRKLYTENDGFKENDKYLSNEYQISRFNPENEDLEKAFYISNTLTKRDTLRELLNGKKAKTIKRPPLEPAEKWEDFFSTIKDYTEYLDNEKLLFGGWVWQHLKRETEIIYYLDTLINEADKIAQSDQYKAVCYLITQKYIYHTNILDEPKADFVFRDEINQIIFDFMQLKINDITQTQTPQIFAPLKPKKPFEWVGTPQSLGTLFGVLFNHDIIKGNKTDFQRQLLELFNLNIKQSYLKDIFDLKIKKDVLKDGKDKYEYCTDTEDLLIDWISFIKSPANPK